VARAWGDVDAGGPLDEEWYEVPRRPTVDLDHGGLLANANFSYSYWQPISRGRAASEEFTRVRLNQTQLVTSRRPLPEVPATTYAGKRLYLLRHGGKEWLDEDRHSRIAMETRMGHEVAGVEGLYSHVTLTMEQEIADSLQTRWLCFVDSEGKYYYRIVLGIVIIALVATRALSPHAAECSG
jgi:hypothetical protein